MFILFCIGLLTFLVGFIWFIVELIMLAITKVYARRILWAAIVVNVGNVIVAIVNL